MFAGVLARSKWAGMHSDRDPGRTGRAERLACTKLVEAAQPMGHARKAAPPRGTMVGTLYLHAP